MEIYQGLPDLCQKFVVHHWVNSFSKSRIAWMLQKDGYMSPHWGIFNMALRNAYVINDEFALVTFNEMYIDELHDKSQSPIPTLKFNTTEFSNLLRLIGNNTITFKCLEIRGVPSPTSWRYIQMLANGCETVKVKSEMPFEALMGFDEPMFKKLVKITKNSKSTEESTRIHTQNQYKFKYGAKDYSTIHAKFGNPDYGVIEINGDYSDFESYSLLVDQINHLRRRLPNYKFKMLLTSQILQYNETFIDLDIISLKILDEDFKWDVLKTFEQFNSKVTKLILNSYLPQNFTGMFPNLSSLTLAPKFNSYLNDLLVCIPPTVTNLHLDLSKFIFGFTFKLPFSIIFLELMCHYLPYSHIIDSENSNLEVLVLTLYSESKPHHLKMTHLPSNFHFMEIRKCLKSEFIQIHPGNDKFKEHIQLESKSTLDYSNINY